MSKWADALRGVLPSVSRWRDADHPSARNGAGSEKTQQFEQGEVLTESARALAPVVWLLGKVGSGKSSIIRAITRSTDAEVGDGFRPCTRTSRIYEFPPEAPVIRFLDTRGLGETGYDPADDIAFSASSAHLVLVTMRAMDAQQEAVVDVLRRARRQHPDWPIVVAQSTLHEGLSAGREAHHSLSLRCKAPVSAIQSVPIDLMRALAFQRALFNDLPGRNPPLFVPMDLTRSEDGLAPAALRSRRADRSSGVRRAGRHACGALGHAGFTADPKSRTADPIVMGHAMAAAGGDLVPVPVAGAMAVTTVQARLLNQLGKLYGIEWDRRAYTELSAALGAGTLVRMASSMGIRQLAKMVPVYGQTAGAAASAAASFAVTYALGKAAAYYLHRRRIGTSDTGGVGHVYQEALRNAFRMARERAWRKLVMRRNNE